VGIIQARRLGVLYQSVSTDLNFEGLSTVLVLSQSAISEPYFKQHKLFCSCLVQKTKVLITNTSVSEKWFSFTQCERYHFELISHSCHYVRLIL
jgi:hypothetical protein